MGEQENVVPPVESHEENAKDCEALENENAALRKENETLRDKVNHAGNLLAVIHRDGGHYIDEFGWEKACQDAQTIAVRLLRECSDAWDSASKDEDGTVSGGCELISLERLRQFKSENVTDERDDTLTNSELALGAVCYANPPGHRRWMDERGVSQKNPNGWPGDAIGNFKPVPTDRVRELVKAGALIAAEIDRLLRDRSKWLKNLRNSRKST